MLNRKLYKDRKLRIKYNRDEKKRKIYKYIERDVSKNVLIFLKKKNMNGLGLSLEDKLALSEMKIEKGEREKRRIKLLDEEGERDMTRLNNIYMSIVSSNLERVFRRIEKKRTFYSTRRIGTGVRIRNRCIMTGTSRSVYRRLRVGRHSLKKEISRGVVPGFMKASF